MNKTYEDITAIILAGGESKRIGENKALLKLGNKTIIELIHHVLSLHFKNILISSNDDIIHNILDRQIIHDIINNHGPLSGIHSGLVNSQTERNFFISCDLPFIDSQSIIYLIESSFDAEIAIPVINKYPLYVCGVYSKKIIPLIKKIFFEFEKPSLKLLTNQVQTKLLEIEKEKFFNPESFVNMNSREDYELVKRIFYSKNHGDAQ
jgi:molybdopterin-guanine dinucleotide biosynthesis protein A